MKNKILKISLSTAAIAAIVTPIATLTSCNKGSIVDPVEPITPEQEKIFNISNGVLYGFKPSTTQKEVDDYIKNGVFKLPSVKTIAANAFNSETVGLKIKATTLDIANSITKIEDKAYFSQEALTTITWNGQAKPTVNAKLNDIGESAFAFDKSLTKFTFPVDLYTGTIGKSAFYCCSNLAELDLSSYDGSTALTKPDWAYGAFTGTKTDSGHVIFNTSVSDHNRGLAWSRLVYAGISPVWHQYKGPGAECDYQYKLLPKEYLTVDENGVFEGANKYLYPESDTNFNVVEFPDTVKSIADGLNSFFKNRKYVTIWNLSKVHDDFTTIPDDTFKDCDPANKTLGSEKAKISLPNTLTTVGESAFLNCKYNPVLNSQSEVLADIGNFAFQNSALDSITIPTSVTAVGNSAFANCTSLENIYIDKWTAAPTWSGAGVFTGSGVTTSTNNKVHIKQLSNKIDQYLLKEELNTYLADTNKGGLVFGSEAGKWQYDPASDITLNDLFDIQGDVLNGWAKKGSGAELTPAEVGAILTKLGITKLTIPNTVKSIAESAFWDSAAFASKIPSVVTEIDFEADEGVYKCTSIGKLAFYKATSLTKISIPNSVTTIGDSAFAECDNVKTIDLSTWEVTAAPAWSATGIFASVGSLVAAGTNKIINVKAYTNQIDQWRYNSYLKKTPLSTLPWDASNPWKFDNADTATPYNITTDGVITGWASGDVTTAPESESKVLNNDEKIALAKEKFGSAEILIPKTVTSIADEAFIDATTKATTIPSAFTTLEFEANTSICTTIGKRAFYQAPFTAVDFSKAAALTTIGDNALDSIQVTTLTLPASLTSVGAGAFCNISTLTTLVFPVFAGKVTFGAACFAHNTALKSIDMTKWVAVPTDAEWEDTTFTMLDDIGAGINGYIKCSNAALADAMLTFFSKHSWTIKNDPTWTAGA